MTLTARRQFILTNNKWQVRTIRSRRRERMLKDLWECVVEGEIFRGGDSDALLGPTTSAVGGYHDATNNDLRSGPDSHGIEMDNDLTESYQLSGEVNGLQDEIDNVTYRRALEQTQDDHMRNDPISLDTSPTLHLGSITKTWLDFGSDQYNMVGERQCLPLIICAPGNCEEDPDTAVYFDVEIGGSEFETGLSFGLQEDFPHEQSSDVKLTIKEGEYQCIYVTWAPLYRGGLRESICVKTTFHGTEELVATNEIIVVGCAKEKDDDSDMGLKQEADLMNEAVPSENQKHHDLAQSPFEQQTSNGEVSDHLDADGPHELSMIDEEGSQHGLEQSCDVDVEEPDSQLTSDSLQTESHDVDQTENEAAQKISSDESSDNRAPKKGITLTFTLKAGHDPKWNISSATNNARPQTRHQQRQQERQQLRNSIQEKVAKIRAQHATNMSTRRDSRGRPIRSTHPSATSFHGLSNRAKLMRSARQARMNMAEQNRADVESKQTIGSSLEDDGDAVVTEKSERSGDDVDGGCEDANESEHGELLEQAKEGAVENPLAESPTEREDMEPSTCVDADFSIPTSDQRLVEAANEDDYSTMITNSPDAECSEEMKSNHTSTSEQHSYHSDGSSDLDRKDDATDHKFDSPATKTMLRTMSNVSVEVDEAELTATSGTHDRSDSKKEVHHETTSTLLADEISDMEDYLVTPRSDVSAANEDSKVDAPIDDGPASSDETPSDGIMNHSTSKAGLTSTGKPKVFTFEQDVPPSPIRTESCNEIIQSEDEMTSPEALLTSKSYENTTNELNQMMAKDQTVPTKRPNTPLKDLHDQINHIINQKSVSPSKKNKELTPEPNHVVPLKIDDTPLALPPSKARQTFPSTKSKTPSSVIRSSMYADTQSSRKSAKKSARQLYFYKSPRNADASLVKSDEKSVDLRKSEEDQSNSRASGKDSTLQQVSSVTAKRHAQIATTTLSDSKAIKVESKNRSVDISSQEQDSSHVSDVKGIRNTAAETIPTASKSAHNGNPSQPARVDPGHESDYKSRIQSIRKNRSNGSLATSGVESALTPSSDEKSHHPPTAKSSARKLYFFKSPSAEPLSGSGAKAHDRERRVSDPVHEIARSNDTPSVPKAKSFVTSPPSPKLTTREQIAIDKHIHSMKKRNASQKSII